MQWKPEQDFQCGLLNVQDVLIVMCYNSRPCKLSNNQGYFSYHCTKLTIPPLVISFGSGS